MPTEARPKRWTTCFLLAIAASLWLAGCNRGYVGPKATPAAKPAAVTPASRKTKPPAEASSRPVISTVATSSQEAWKRQLAAAESAFSSGRLEEARSALAGLDAIYSGQETPSPQQEQDRQTLELRVAQAQRAALDQQREEKLAASQAAMNGGRFEEALALAAEVQGQSPSPNQQEQAAALRVEVRRRQQVKKDWQPHLAMLASTSRRELEAAQAELRKDPDAALSLLAEISERPDQPALLAGALETLAKLDRPQQVLPLLVAVLRRDGQRDAWQVAARQIVRLKQSGAGEGLLELALDDAPIEQRLAALETLSQVVDPPPRTLAALLPILYREGPLLRLALLAAAHGVTTHGQWDLALHSGTELSPLQQEQLARLPERLSALSAGDQNAPGDVALAAQTLVVALRLAPPQPLTEVKVHKAPAELPDSAAAAVLDGTWNSTDAKTMWRHPEEQPGSITLDLGKERTVAAVKIWNVNEPGTVGRGWKNLKISVGTTESEWLDVAAGIVPLAPGAAGTPDYGTIVTVPCVRARYVRLQAESTWQTGGPSGLSEVQVLGF